MAAENLFLQKQLAFYQERKVRPRPLTDPARLSLVLWSRFFDWKPALRIVKPDTLVGGTAKASSYFGAGSRGAADRHCRGSFVSS